MDKNTVFTYDNDTKKIVFAYAANIWVTSVRGLSENDVSISETQSTGQSGSTITDTAVQPKIITINGIITSDIANTREKMLSCIVPAKDARLTITQNGESWYLLGTPTKTPLISNEKSLQTFQFSFRAPFPFWRTTAENKTSIAGLTPLFKTPFSTSGKFYISKYSESLYKNVVNTGDSPIEIDVDFEASTPVLTPELYHITTNTFIRVNRNMQTGERFEVSTVYGRKGAKLINADGTETNGFKWLDIDSNIDLALLPGDNLFRYSAATEREGLKVTVTAPKGVRSGV